MPNFIMQLRNIILTLLLAASTSYAENQSKPFAPELFVFENGARFGAVENQVKVLKELGYHSLGSAAAADLPARLKLYQEAGLKISSLYLGGRIGEGKKVQEINPALPEAIKQLKGHDSMIELFVQGNSHNTDEEAVSFVREVADLAKSSGLKVVIYPHVGFYIDTLEDAVRIAKLSDRDNVGVMFNLCHFLKTKPESDLRPTLENAGDLLWRVSTCGADADGSSWASLIQTLDKGSFDQVSFLKTLRHIGFSGDVGLQCYSIKGDPKTNLSLSITAWRTYLAASLKE